MLGNSGVITAQCYGMILRFQGNGAWSSVEHPGRADLSRMKQSEQSYRKCRAGDGDAKPKWLQHAQFLVGKCGSVEVNQKALA